MNTNMTGFRSLSKIFASLCFGRKQPQHWKCSPFDARSGKKLPGDFDEIFQAKAGKRFEG